VQITPETVEASLRALNDLAVRNPTLFSGHGFDLSHPTMSLSQPASASDPRIVDYWIGTGTHHRTSPIESKFAMQLSLVRISVADNWELTPIETAIGTMYAGDHKLYSPKVASDYLSDVSDTLQLKLPVLDRVHVMSPTRSGGARFGAIGVYLFYTENQRRPFAYALEAGMATGESRVLYFGPDFVTPILRHGYYTPTPFSDPNFYYRGLVTLTAEGDPATFCVEVLNDKQSAAHMRVDVAYSLVSEKDVPNVFPAILTLQAACRIAAIAEASKVPFPDLGVLTPLFAQLGRDLYPWITKPGATS
jgi:hypothetical protein